MADNSRRGVGDNDWLTFRAESHQAPEYCGGPRPLRNRYVVAVNCDEEKRHFSPEECFNFDSAIFSRVGITFEEPFGRPVCQPIVTNNCAYQYGDQDQTGRHQGLCYDYRYDDVAASLSPAIIKATPLLPVAERFRPVKATVSQFGQFPNYNPFNICTVYGTHVDRREAGLDFGPKSTILVNPDDFRRLYKSNCQSWSSCESCVSSSSMCTQCGWCQVSNDVLLWGLLLLSDMWNHEITVNPHDTVDPYYHIGDLLVGAALLHLHDRKSEELITHIDIRSKLAGYEDLPFYAVPASKIYLNLDYCKESELNGNQYAQTTYCGSAVNLIPVDILPRNPLNCSQVYHLAKNLNILFGISLMASTYDKGLQTALHNYASNKMTFKETVDLLGPLTTLGFCTDNMSSADFVHSACYGGLSVPSGIDKLCSEGTSDISVVLTVLDAVIHVRNDADMNAIFWPCLFICAIPMLFSSIVLIFTFMKWSYVRLREIESARKERDFTLTASDSNTLLSYTKYSDQEEEEVVYKTYSDETDSKSFTDTSTLYFGSSARIRRPSQGPLHLDTL